MLSSVRWGRWLVCVLAIAGIASISWYANSRGRARADVGPTSVAGTPAANVAVEVVVPRKGGIDRICNQPGSIEPFEAADLYTKVSGFLIEQNVDIGDPVKAGDVLARIAVPEHDKQVKQERAGVVRAEARVAQMTAAIATAQADLGAAGAAIALAEAEKKSKTSYRAYREKQRDRFRELVARMAIDAKLADEQEDQYQAAISADLAAGEAIHAAREKEAAARARVKQAQADLNFAQAEVAAAQARLEQAQVYVDYSVLRSPYTGVITKRNFHPGDFIRSADTGGERVPIFAVERTDLMRVIIQVPERDVPYVDRGDPATVEVDALPGVVYKTNGADKVAVTRLAASEDPHTRMMRTEVHLKNTDGKLRRGMYGRVAIHLQPGSPDSLRIPSAALSGKANDGKASIRTVRDGIVHIVPVRYGADNGSEVDILSGLSPTDRVIVRASGTIDEGTPVGVVDAKTSSAGR